MDVKETPARPVELHIDELVLEGFDPGDVTAVADGMREQLARRLAERGVPESVVERGEVDALEALELRPATSPHAVGRAAGDSLHGAFER
ncbi:MAG TPA: hypothetical protein VNN79_11250 [Actinomycetota bacterium]|nr:hypothetical protein [Actinomycetota bacterium]